MNARARVEELNDRLDDKMDKSSPAHTAQHTFSRLQYISIGMYITDHLCTGHSFHDWAFLVIQASMLFLIAFVPLYNIFDFFV
jgi:hypothetical protein